MRLTPQERDRLLIATAAAQARRRHDRGLLLNVPESIALISDTVIEAARDGQRMAEVVAAGHAALTSADVLPGVADIVTDVAVEAVFDDGTRLVVVTDPFGPPPGDGRGHRLAPEPLPADRRPGAVLTAPAPPDVLTPGRLEVIVRNTADVPVTVTSHWHFFEANAALRFDRAAAYGMHLDVPAGTGVRFDPHERVTVALVPIGGARVAVGFAGLVDGPLDEPGARERAVERAVALGYQSIEPGGMP